MTVRAEKPSVNLREKLAELDKPTGIAGEAMLRAETVVDQAELLGYRQQNVIINGAMQVFQRGTSDDTATNGDFSSDRWKLGFGGLDGNVDWDQETSSTPEGFGSALKISTDASETSLDAGDYILLEQRIEGQDVQMIGKGTSSAKHLTLSFWVRSSVASTYTAEILDNNNNRLCGRSYYVNQADTWEYKTLVFPPDATGSLTNNANHSLSLVLWIDAGTTYTSGTFSTNWQASDTDERVYDTTGWLESTSPTFYITGVQLVAGNYPDGLPFMHRSYGEELALCQRYYYKANADGQSNNPALGIGYFGSTTEANLIIPFPTTMRANPTSLGQSGTASDYKVFYSGTVTVCSDVPSFEQASREAGRVTFTISSGGTLGLGAHGISATTGGYLAWSAEL
jgi:hypothetical protein